MNDKVGLVSFSEDKNSLRPYSNKLAALMETEVSRLVSDAYFKTEKLLKENYNKLELVFIVCSIHAFLVKVFICWFS